MKKRLKVLEVEFPEKRIPETAQDSLNERSNAHEKNTASEGPAGIYGFTDVT